MNDRPDPVLLRAALQIHASIGEWHERLPTVTLPEWSWAECLKLQQKLQIARSREWTGAARRIRQRLQTTLICLQSEVEQQLRTLAHVATPPSVTSVSEIVRDLAALMKEFEGKEVDLRRHTITVQTEPIVLEGVNLGSFEICLEWSRLGDAPHYVVNATDPHRPAVDSSVTHPHVDDGVLCEGEGKTAVREALQGGRLLDFFLIVRQILQSYNRSSAYVTLNEWDGRYCSDCGDSVCDDEAFHCQSCESPLCGECCLGCSTCCETFCNGCLTRCGGCEQPLCHSCLNRCPDCEGDRCEECLSEEGSCAECRTTDEDDSDSKSCQSGADRTAAAAPHTPQSASSAPQAAAAAPAIAHAPIQSDRLGQAPVPA